jgi:hypothetical protein
MASSNSKESQKKIKSEKALSNKKVAQEYLDEKYPKNGVCKRDSDKKNKNKNRREEIIELDLNKLGRSGNKKLEGYLKLEGFINLEILKCSSHQLTSLDVSECLKLKKLDCDSNRINSLNVKNLTELEEINCYNNKISEFDLTDNTELKKIYCHQNLLEKIIGLEKLRKLSLINSTPFGSIKQLGEDIDNAKKFLIGDNGDGGYKKLMEEQVNAYKRVNNSGVFESKEVSQYQIEISNYETQMTQVEILTNK